MVEQGNDSAGKADAGRSIQQVITIIENQLSAAGTSVKITPVEQLVGVNKTYRCDMNITSGEQASNESIIIKYNPKFPSQSNMDQTLLADLDDYLKRFNNEAAALTYLNKVQFPHPVHPKLLHYDIENQLIVTRDMGKSPTLMDVMKNPQLDEPEACLKSYLRLFAELHKRTFTTWRSFKETQKILNASSPLSDSTIDFREYPYELEELIDYIRTRYELDKGAVIKEFYRVENTVFDTNNPLYGFIHADSGIQNINVDRETGEMVLFDYEFADSGYILLDIAGLFLGFPQSAKGKRVPSRFYDSLMREYFNSLTFTTDNPEKDLLYALLHWTVGRLISSWMFFIKPHIGDLNSVGIEFLNRVYTSNHECLNFLKDKPHFSQLKGFLKAAQLIMEENWENIEQISYFPAFIGK